MNKSVFAIVILMTIALAGCGKRDSAEHVAKDMTANMKEMGAILASVTDEASAKAAIPKIHAVREKMRDCAKRAKAVPDVDGAMEAKIEQMNRPMMEEAIRTIAEAQQRLAGQPQLMAIIQPAMQGMEDDL